MSHKPSYKFVQCFLEKKFKSGITGETNILEMTSFVPECFAVKGKILKVKNSDGKWSDGWVVKKAYNIVFDLENILKVESQHKNTRKVSDI